MKKKKSKMRIYSIVMAAAILSQTLVGCNGNNSNPTEGIPIETESVSVSLERTSAEAATSVTASTTEKDDEERKKIRFTEEKEQLIKSLEQYIDNYNNMKASTERDVYDFYLNTLQVYYEACGDYTTEEGTIGDLITSDVADSLSGGSSTISSSIQAAAKGIQKNGVTGELVTDVFAATMEELPKEIVSKVMEYLLGGTIMKALDILKAAIPQNEQTQHLVNMIDYDVKNDINALAAICQKSDLTAEDCYMGGILVDSIMRKTSMIERITGLNAGSFAWSPIQGNSWVSLDLSAAVSAIQDISITEKFIDILKNMEEPPKVAEGEYEEFKEAYDHIEQDIRENPQDSELSLLQLFGDLGSDITGAYDAEDAEARSKSTNLMNSVNKIIGNPISDIFVYSKNAEEKVFADALFSYNAAVIPLWKERYVPLVVQTEWIVKTMNNFMGMFMGASPWTDTTPEMKVALMKAYFGGLPSMESFDDTMSDIAKELIALSAQTDIMKSAYSFALIDSQSNTSFLRKYEWADHVIRNLCLSTEKGCEVYALGFRSDSAVEKTAKASRDLIQAYIKSIDNREDLYIKRSTYHTAACGGLTYSYLYKRPSNGVSSPTLYYIRETKEGDKYGRFYYFLGNSRNCYWVSDKNRSYLGFPGYYPTGAGDYFTRYPEQITEENWRPVLLAERGEGINSSSWDSGALTQKDVEWFAEDLNNYLTADVAAAQKEKYEAIENSKKSELIREAYEKKISDLNKKVESGKEQWLLDPEKVALSFVTYYLKIENPTLLNSEYTPEGEYNQEGMTFEFEYDSASTGEICHIYVHLHHPDFLESESPMWVATGYTVDNRIGNFSTEEYMSSIKEP